MVNFAVAMWILVHRRAAIHEKRLPGHEIAVVRREKEQRADKIVRRFFAFERAALDVEGAHSAVIVAAHGP